MIILFLYLKVNYKIKCNKKTHNMIKRKHFMKIGSRRQSIGV